MENRTQGVEFNVWQKDYNDTVTGLSWNYPEFKGFHDKVYWARLATKNLPITFINHADDIALRVFTPKEASGEGFEPKGTHIDFLPGDISFSTRSSRSAPSSIRRESLTIRPAGANA
jgi:hypothetical protein